jgi:hypothetical protein
MGLTINAYYKINQDEFSEFIKENKINVNNWEQCTLVAKYFYEKITGEKIETNSLGPATYFYNKEYDMHDLIDFHGCKYIRDHKLLNNNHPSLPELPERIRHCIFYIRTPEDAIRIATDLRDYFPEDEDILYFANWLEKTSKYCYAYRISI